MLWGQQWTKCFFFSSEGEKFYSETENGMTG